MSKSSEAYNTTHWREIKNNKMATTTVYTTYQDKVNNNICSYIKDYISQTLKILSKGEKEITPKIERLIVRYVECGGTLFRLKGSRLEYGLENCELEYKFWDYFEKYYRIKRKATPNEKTC